MAGHQVSGELASRRVFGKEGKQHVKIAIAMVDPQDPDGCEFFRVVAFDNEYATESEKAGRMKLLSAKLGEPVTILVAEGEDKDGGRVWNFRGLAG